MWFCLAVPIDPVGLKVPVAGSYNSAEARVELPPAMRTFPVGRRVAVWVCLAVPMDPVGVKVPVAGSYSSAEAREIPLEEIGLPPASRTFPFGSSVEVCRTRAVPIDPVGLKTPVAGS